MRTRIPLHQLRVGIYVAGIDCSWFRTPFLNRFLVQTVEQIERFRRSNIHYPRRGYRPLQRARRHVLPDSEETLHAIGLHFLTQSPPAHDAPRSLGTLSQELTMAPETRDKLAQSVNIVFDEFSKTGAARPGPVKEAVQKITFVI